MPAGVASTAICQHENTGSSLIKMFPIRLPPVFDAITTKFACILCSSECQIPFVSLDVIDSMRDNDTSCTRLKIMIVHLNGLATMSFPLPIKVPYHLFFLHLCS